MEFMRNVKPRVKKVLLKSAFTRLTSLVAAPGIVILRYHSVLYDPEPYAHTIGAGIIHSYGGFRKQMETVARDYKPVSVQDAYGFLRDGKPLRCKSVAVTFDDGFADNYEIAAPLLNRLGIPAAFYIVVNAIESPNLPWYCRLRHAFHATRKEFWTDSAEDCIRPIKDHADRKNAFLVASRRCAQLTGEAQNRVLATVEQELDVETLSSRDCPMMTWDQVRGLQKGGHIVGSHTLTHPNLAYVNEDNLRKEIVESKRALEEKLGSPSHHFSYPSPIMEPHFTGLTMEWTQQAGYQTAVTCTPGPVHAGQNPLSLRRVSPPTLQDDFLWSLGCSFIGYRV